ncbi:hypothetical protein [Pseudomonas fluorescens]|uniref:hypothetical protein n=1 Tax=Pseudomonas fluorescens TaxID=294 RepID=UPI001241EBE7|nr:hypothetical protein [Pseudomonas fluorescens]
MTGAQWTTQKFKIKPKYKLDSANTLKQAHAKLNLNNDFLIEQFNWAHTFSPITYYRNCNKPNRNKRFIKYLGMMCQDCIYDDIKIYGVAYVHGSHNFPQIRFCHKHSTQLEETCSSCGLSHILHTASDYYDHNHQRVNTRSNSKASNATELKHAQLISELLNSIKIPIKPGSITQASFNRAIELGLNQGFVFNLKAVEAHAATVLNETPLTLNITSRPIFSSSTPWERFCTILFVLFKDASLFFEYVNTCQSETFISQPHTELHQNRLKLSNILNSSNYNNHQELLGDNLELIQWLKKNDPTQQVIS